MLREGLLTNVARGTEAIVLDSYFTYECSGRDRGDSYFTYEYSARDRGKARDVPSTHLYLLYESWVLRTITINFQPLRDFPEPQPPAAERLA